MLLPSDELRTRHAVLLPSVILVSQPWDWLELLLRAAREWIFSDAIRELPANAGLFLITGGLSILTLIVSLVFLQNVLPLRSNNPIAVQTLPAERELRPIDPKRPGRIIRPVGGAQAGRSPGLHPVDTLLESMLVTGLGEPRVLYHIPNRTVLRLYLCPGCASGNPGTDTSGCVRERTAIQGAFSTFFRKNVTTTEAKCRRRGDPECEFEVAH